MTKQQTVSDYERVARAIHFIDETRDTQPGLDEVAAHLGLSAAHFQRLFSRWTGVSPKKYQQYLTLNHAKTLLQQRNSVLDTALQSGLSGPGRLHDLLISWEAMTPGEYAKGGETLEITYGFSGSVFGEALVLWTARGICGMGFTAEMGRHACLHDMQRRWPKAFYFQDDKAAEVQIDTIFSGAATRLLLGGAPFQIKVWEALLSIPSGYVTTYSSIAAKAGNPKAVRAVGTAVGRNPVSWLIPCHRALRKSGGLGGYHWGLPVKRAMLAYESARFDVYEGACGPV